MMILINKPQNIHNISIKADLLRLQKIWSDLLHHVPLNNNDDENTLYLYGSSFFDIKANNTTSRPSHYLYHILYKGDWSNLVFIINRRFHNLFFLHDLLLFSKLSDVRYVWYIDKNAVCKFLAYGVNWVHFQLWFTAYSKIKLRVLLLLMKNSQT